jgi:hypothetical protein
MDAGQSHQVASQVGDCVALAELQGNGYIFIDLDFEIASVMQGVGMKAVGLSGVVVNRGDEGREEVWATESCRPFDLVTSYTRMH